MLAHWVFQLSLIEVVCQSYSDWMTRPGQRRLFFQIVIKLRNSRSPRERSTSTRWKITNGSQQGAKSDQLIEDRRSDMGVRSSNRRKKENKDRLSKAPFASLSSVEPICGGRCDL